MIELQTTTVAATGVYPVATSAAPQTYAELLQCGAQWQYALGDVQLPVWNGASDTSIYGSDTALKLAARRGQLAIFDTTTGQDVPVPVLQ
jgi:hypothetical protein